MSESRQQGVREPDAWLATWKDGGVIGVSLEPNFMHNEIVNVPLYRATPVPVAVSREQYESLIDRLFVATMVEISVPVDASRAEHDDCQWTDESVCGTCIRAMDDHAYDCEIGMLAAEYFALASRPADPREPQQLSGRYVACPKCNLGSGIYYRSRVPEREWGCSYCKITFGTPADDAASVPMDAVREACEQVLAMFNEDVSPRAKDILRAALASREPTEQTGGTHAG